jgi:hypothetical protein
MFYCCVSLRLFVLDTTLVVWEDRHLPTHNLLVNSNDRRTARIGNVTYIRKEVACLGSNKDFKETSPAPEYININADWYTKPREFQDVITQKRRWWIQINKCFITNESFDCFVINVKKLYLLSKLLLY